MGPEEAERTARADLIGTSAPFDEFDPRLESVEAIGIDSGATLVKVAMESSGGIHFATLGSPSTDRLRDHLERTSPTHLCVTGCGAAALEAELTEDGIRDILSPIEFEAWARGANEMLTRLGEPAIEPYLLVSIGTGTSILRVEGDQVERVGGTALGGGAALGLGLALTGVGSSQELNELALQGDRSSIDLMVSDIFENAEGIGAMIASGFGKLARNAALPESERETPNPADLASAIMGIVADNIGLLVAAHARGAGVSRIVFGGSTLITHPQIELTIRGIAALGGFESSVLPHPGHAGALGAMLMRLR